MCYSALLSVALLRGRAGAGIHPRPYEGPRLRAVNIIQHREDNRSVNRGQRETVKTVSWSIISLEKVFKSQIQRWSVEIMDMEYGWRKANIYGIIFLFLRIGKVYISQTFIVEFSKLRVSQFPYSFKVLGSTVFKMFEIHNRLKLKLPVENTSLLDIQATFSCSFLWEEAALIRLMAEFRE